MPRQLSLTGQIMSALRTAVKPPSSNPWPPECNLLACFDLNCFAGGRIAPHASSPLPNLKNSKTSDMYPFALLEMLRDNTDEIDEEGFNDFAQA